MPPFPITIECDRTFRPWAILGLSMFSSGTCRFSWETFIHDIHTRSSMPPYANHQQGCSRNLTVADSCFLRIIQNFLRHIHPRPPYTNLYVNMYANNYTVCLKNSGMIDFRTILRHIPPRPKCTKTSCPPYANKYTGCLKISTLPDFRTVLVFQKHIQIFPQARTSTTCIYPNL
jgi:hypothetical protein